MKDELPMTSNITNETLEILSRDEKLAQIEIGTLICIFTVSVIGNGLVLLALYVKKCQRGRKPFSRMYFFILHLCIADLINAFFNTLPQLLWDVTYRFKGGQLLCKAVKYGQIFGPYLSSYILVATAMDRYRAICYPLTYNFWSFKKSRVFVIYAWCISITFSIPQIFIFSFREIVPGVWDCWATFLFSWGDRAYVVWYSTSVFIVPLLGLIYTYSFICRVIWTNTPKELGKQQQVISRAKINTIKQTIAVIVTYIVCSLPFIVAELWAVWDPTVYESAWSGPLFTILLLLSSLHSCANPWIFMVFNSDLFVLLRIFLERKILASATFKRNDIEEASHSENESRKKTSWTNCCNLRKMFTSGKRKSDVIGLKRWTNNTDECGVTIATEVSTLNSSKDSE